MTRQTDLFETRPNQEQKDDSRSYDPLELASHRLAVQFTEDDQLPAHYRKRPDSAQKVRKRKEDAEVEKRFRTNVASWRVLIETMLVELKPEQAWRFINLSPHISKGSAKVTDNTDFCELVDYMILLRMIGEDEFFELVRQT